MLIKGYSGIQNYENTEILAGQGFQLSCLSLTGTGIAIAWFIIADHHQGYVLVPREQSWRKTGGWTAGRAIALKNLDQQSDSLNYLTPQDRQICTHLECYPVGYYGRFKFQFKGQAFVELVGHPLVFWDSQPPVKMEVVRGEPELLVQRGQNGDLLMQLQPDFYGGQEVVLIKESLTRLKVIAAKPQHQKIAAILGKNNRLQIPSRRRHKCSNSFRQLTPYPYKSTERV